MRHPHEGAWRVVNNNHQVFINDTWVDVRTITDYDKGREDMLEQVIKQWEEVLTCWDRTAIQVIEEFYERLKAMRQQEES